MNECFGEQTQAFTSKPLTELPPVFKHIVTVLSLLGFFRDCMLGGNKRLSVWKELAVGR